MTFHSALLRTLVPFLAIAALASVANGQVTFNDGTAHTIPGTDGDITDTNGGVGAEIEDSGGGAATSLTLNSTGTISIDTSGGGTSATAVQVRDNSIFEFADGTLFARDNSGGGDAYGIQAFDFATVIVSGNDSFNVRDQGGGNARGIIASGSDSPTIVLSGTINQVRDQGNASSIGIELTNNTSANVTVTNSGVIADVLDSGGGSAYGIYANGSGNASTIDFAGSIAVNESGGGDAYGIRTQGTSVANVSGFLDVDEADAGNARVLRADDFSTINIQSGFSYDVTQASGNRRFIQATEDSTINIYGGNLTNTDAGAGTGSSRIEMQGDSILNIFGEEFLVDGADPTLVGTVSGIPGFLVYDLNAGLGIVDIEGILTDGTPFNNQVDIGANASVSLLQAVPEPATIAIWTLLGLTVGGFGIFRARQKK